jgi:septal ring factor EnvC (AmiA/AmiB activator)
MPLRCEAQSFLSNKPTNVSVQQQANHIQAELAALQVQLSSANTNVDGLTSRLEDVQTDLSEKEQLNNELLQEKAALKAQVGKRELLDEKGGLRRSSCRNNVRPWRVRSGKSNLA